MSDWDDMGTLWRSNEPPELGNLRKRLKRQSLFIKLWFAQEIVLALAAGGLGLWLMLTSDIGFIGAGVIGFSAFAMTMSWRAWRGTFRIDTGTPLEAITSALARNAALKRYIMANYTVSLVAAVLIGALAFSGTADDAAKPHRAVLTVTVGLGAIIAWLVGCGIYAERLTRERERLVTLARALGVETP